MVPKGDRMLLEFNIPSRGIIGLRNYLLTVTAGEAIMSHRFIEFQAYKGDIPQRQNGSLVSMENGKAIPYSIDKLQDRGRFSSNLKSREKAKCANMNGKNTQTGGMTPFEWQMTICNARRNSTSEICDLITYWMNLVD